MQTHPYLFKRAGELVAKLESNGQFHSNADGAGWLTYDSLLDFFQDAGIDIHPVEYITQVAELVNALPEIDLAAMQAAARTVTAPAPAQAIPPAPAPPTAMELPPAPPKPKRGRAAKPPVEVQTAGAGAASMASTAGATANTPTDPIPQVGTPAPTANPLMDPAVQAFLASQKAAAANNPPLPVPVAGAAAVTVAVDAAPVVVPTSPAPAPMLTPLAPTPTPAPPPPTPVQLPTSNVSTAVDALIKTHGIANVTATFVEWATNGATAAESYGLVETAKRLRAIATAHGLAQGL